MCIAAGALKITCGQRYGIPSTDVVASRAWAAAMGHQPYGDAIQVHSGEKSSKSACSVRLDAAASSQVFGVQNVDQLVCAGRVKVIQQPPLPVRRNACEDIDHREKLPAAHSTR